MSRVSVLVLTALACAAVVQAQDERRVTSPDGQIEFRAFFVHPEPGAHARLAYQVYYRGQRFINTSFLGLDIHDQPILGENAGMITSKSGSSDGYNTLTADYMQNGSLGRRINLEVRAYNDGVAFRYLIPKSGPLEHMPLENELTEFEFMADTEAVTKIAPNAVVPLPFVAEQPGLGWVSITEVRAGNSYPKMYLSRTEGRILISRLPPRPDESRLAWEGTTPMTCPWRVLIIGPTRERVTGSKLAGSLNP